MVTTRDRRARYGTWAFHIRECTTGSIGGNTTVGSPVPKTSYPILIPSRSR
jgi:hypothetical protein